MKYFTPRGQVKPTRTENGNGCKFRGSSAQINSGLGSLSESMRRRRYVANSKDLAVEMMTTIVGSYGDGSGRGDGCNDG